MNSEIGRGYKSDKLKRFSCNDQITIFQLYTGDDNNEADTVDFKKALDLLEYLPTTGADPEELRQEKEDLRLKIWARSVLRNPWASLDTDNPINVIAETVFFRLVKLIELCNVVLRLGIEILAYGALIVCAKLI